jgi:hypothetical protein
MQARQALACPHSRHDWRKKLWRSSSKPTLQAGALEDCSIIKRRGWRGGETVKSRLARFLSLGVAFWKLNDRLGFWNLFSSAALDEKPSQIT